MRLERFAGAPGGSVRWEPPPRLLQIRRSSILPIITTFFPHTQSLTNSRSSRRNSAATQILQIAASDRFPSVFNHRHLLSCIQSLTQLATLTPPLVRRQIVKLPNEPSPISGHFAPPLWRMFPAGADSHRRLLHRCTFFSVSIKLSRKLWNSRIPQRGVHYCL